MTRRSISVLFVVALAGLAAATAARAQVPVRTWAISVQVNSTKPDGAAWDAFGGAPDIGLCTASSGGSGCAMTEGSAARCQDAFGCTFSLSLPETFSASLWDLDVAADDLIGTCFIDHPGTYQCGSATVTAR